MSRAAVIALAAVVATTGLAGCIGSDEPGCDFKILITAKSDGPTYSPNVGYQHVEGDGSVLYFKGEFGPGNGTVQIRTNTPDLDAESVRRTLWEWGELRRGEDFSLSYGYRGQLGADALGKLCKSIVPTMLDGIKENGETAGCFHTGLMFFKVTQDGRTVEYFRRCADGPYPRVLSEFETALWTLPPTSPAAPPAPED